MKPSRVNRRTALTGLAGAAASAAGALTPRRARAAATRIRVLTDPGDSTAVPFYAADRGFFAEAGLDAEIGLMANGGVIVPAVIGGAAEFGVASITTVAFAHLRGVPLLAVCPSAIYTDRAPTSELLVGPGSPIRTARDLEGKTVAVAGLNTNSDIATKAWIDKNGGNSKSSNYVEFSYSAMIPALMDGRVDAALLVEPTLTIAKRDGCRVLALAYGAVAPQYCGGCFVAMQAWLAENADLAQRFVEAMGRAAVWANGHHAESLAIVARYLKLDPQTLGTMTRAIYSPRLEPAQVQPLIDVAARYGALARSFPAREIIWS